MWNMSKGNQLNKHIDLKMDQIDVPQKMIYRQLRYSFRDTISCFCCCFLFFVVVVVFLLFTWSFSPDVITLFAWLYYLFSLFFFAWRLLLYSHVILHRVFPAARPNSPA